MPLPQSDPFSPQPFESDGSVSAQTRELLDTCQIAIEKARKLLPFGAGNQLQDIRRTNGESTARAFTANLMCPKNSVGQNAPLWASCPAAVLTGAGNCGFQSVVVHDLLRELLSSEHFVAFAFANGVDHQFTVAWHRDAPSIKVAADSWTIHAQAILLKDHFAGSGATFKIRRACGKRHSLLDRRGSKFGLLNDRPFYDSHNPNPPRAGLAPFTPTLLDACFAEVRAMIPADLEQNPSVFDIAWSSSKNRELHYEYRPAKRKLSR